MNKSWTKIGLSVCAVTAIAGSASAQKASNAERGLVGINLYDSGAKVVALYGSPDDIQAVTIGGASTGGSGGGSGPSGGPGFGGPSGGRPGRGGGGGAAAADWASPGNTPLTLGDKLFQGTLAPPPRVGGSATPGGPPSGAGGPGFAGGPPSGGGGAPSGGNSQAEATKYTRWVYNRGGSKYGFIVDNQGRVVQIEAIGLQNNRVKTRKGLGFGSTFAQLIKSYGNPDGYEVGGDSLLVKYLVNKKVAFRLTRLQAKKPYVVTGIVVSAGKV